MSNINKQALRDNAESTIGILENIAGFEPSDIDGDAVELRFETEGGFDTGCDVSIVDQCQKAADVVRALLDELEAKDKSISFLKDQLAQLANFNPDWDKLEAATDSLREHMAELTAARARIAELEAREVKLPQRYSMLHRADFDEPYHTVFVYKQHQVIEVLQAAGIRINGEG